MLFESFFLNCKEHFFFWRNTYFWPFVKFWAFLHILLGHLVILLLSPPKNFSLILIDNDKSLIWIKSKRDSTGKIQIKAWTRVLTVLSHINLKMIDLQVLPVENQLLLWIFPAYHSLIPTALTMAMQSFGLPFRNPDPEAVYFTPKNCVFEPLLGSLHQWKWFFKAIRLL